MCPSTLPAHGAGKREDRIPPEQPQTYSVLASTGCWSGLPDSGQQLESGSWLCSKARTSNCDFIGSSPSMGQDGKKLQNSTGPNSLATSQLSSLLTSFSTQERWLAASPAAIPAQPGGLNIPWDCPTSCIQAAQQEPAHAHTRRITPKVSMIHKIPTVLCCCPTLSRKAEVVGKPRNQPSPADTASGRATGTAGPWHSCTTAEVSAALRIQHCTR